jgi:hypothetical protein
LQGVCRNPSAIFRNYSQEANGMSHITRIRTQMVEQEYLTKALDDLGYTYEVEQGDRVRVELPGFLRRKVRFSKRGGAYELVGDFWGLGRQTSRDADETHPAVRLPRDDGEA